MVLSVAQSLLKVREHQVKPVMLQRSVSILNSLVVLPLILDLSHLLCQLADLIFKGQDLFSLGHDCLGV